MVGTSRSTAIVDDVDDNHDPGFFCHFVVVILSVAYVVWIVRCWFHDTILLLLHQRMPVTAPSASGNGPTTAAVAAWTYVIPLTLVFIFYAAPMLYGAINALSAHAPESLHVILDQHPKQPFSTTTANSAANSSRSFKEHIQQQAIPEICDLDVSWINDLIWTTDPHVATYAHKNKLKDT